MPDTPDYLNLIRELAQGKDPVAAQVQAPTTLAELISGIPADRLTARPAPDKWSISEILAHLAEDEIATAWRYRQIVEHPGIDLPRFDQDLWAPSSGASPEFTPSAAASLSGTSPLTWSVTMPTTSGRSRQS